MLTATLRVGSLIAIGTLLARGTGGPPPPVAGPFDGIWTSSHLGHDFFLDGPKGKAISSSRATIQRDDLVFEMAAIGEDMRFSGKQLLADGTWHEFLGELKADGKIYCADGKSAWVLEWKP